MSGVCALWSSGNVLKANVGAREIAVVRFSVYADKNQGTYVLDKLLCILCVCIIF